MAPTKTILLRAIIRRQDGVAGRSRQLNSHTHIYPPTLYTTSPPLLLHSSTPLLLLLVPHTFSDNFFLRSFSSPRPLLLRPTMKQMAMVTTPPLTTSPPQVTRRPQARLPLQVLRNAMIKQQLTTAVLMLL